MKKFDEINIIPFIDIMLVLLAIVLITASFISQGKIQPQAAIDFVLMPDGRVLVNASNVRQLPTPLEIVGEVTYIIGASQFDK